MTLGELKTKIKELEIDHPEIDDDTTEVNMVRIAYREGQDFTEITFWQ